MKKRNNKEDGIVLLELFAGVGGFHRGLEDAGHIIKKCYFSEIDKHAIANYKYNFPNAEYLGSVTDISGAGIQRPDIITFGWPCQDNSIAGKRKGHRPGTRSGLLFEAARLISILKPRLFIAENVKGLFSVNAGKDFYEAVRLLSYLDTDSPQYTVEMQLLNTSWLLPQNRERTYFVGHSGITGIKRIFPIGESDCGVNVGNTANETTTVKTISAGGHSGGQHSGMTLVFSDRGQSGETIMKEEIVGALSSRSGAGFDHAIIQQPICVAMRGRNPANPSDRTTGAPTEQRLEPNSPTLTSNIRRLTPIETERLQGYPDNFTAFGNYDGIIKPIPKTQRYKLVGNAVSVPIVQLIGNKI